MSAAPNQEMVIDAGMPMGDFLNKVVVALISNGQEASTMVVNSRLNGKVGPVEVTVSVAKHPVNVEHNRIAAQLLANMPGDEATGGAKAHGFNTIASKYAAYAGAVLPRGVSAAQHRESKRMFYAGAQAVLVLMLDEIARPGLSDDAGVHILQGLHEECGLFGEEVAAGRA